MPVDTSNFDKFILQVVGTVGAPVEAQIVTTDPKVQKYWPVLEFGSGEGQRPWPEPKTHTVVGADGRIHSKQSPQGFIRRNGQRFYQYLTEAYVRRVQILKRPLNRGEMVEAANDAAARSLELLRSSVPVKSGKLKNSLRVNAAK